MRAFTAISDSNDVSGSSYSTGCASATPVSSHSASRDSPAEFAGLKRFSDTLESILFENPPPQAFDFFADARLIAASGREIPVHRCLLSARSLFFKNLFMSKESNCKIELKEVMKEHDVSNDALMTVLSYVYSGKIRPWPKDVCVCVDDECLHLACWPVVSFILEVLYTSFVFEIEELVHRFQGHVIDILDKIEVDDVLLVLSTASMCGKACESLLARSVEIIVKSNVDMVTIDKLLPPQLVKKINDSRIEHGLQSAESENFPDKHVKRIHRALESDDVELVRMLLKEGHTNLDDAHALHFAVAYCDAKTTAELLDLAIADINLRNSRGYTVLHVAAIRKEPNIVVSLLTKGARPFDLTSNGRTALQITKRLTSALSYNKGAEEGKATPKDRLCIEILEQAERRDPLLGEASMSLAMASDDLHRKLLYLENRVTMAKLLFPMEAKVAMDIAGVVGTSDCHLIGVGNMSDCQKNVLDLNEAPFKIKEEHLIRLRSLSKTVELGKRFFPRCSAVLNKILDGDDFPDMAQLAIDYHGECPVKKQKRLELEEAVSKAFTEDKEEFNQTINFSSASSSSSVGMMRPNGFSGENPNPLEARDPLVQEGVNRGFFRTASQ